MAQMILTKIEKNIVDKNIIFGIDNGYYKKFDVFTFNHALATSLPQWRVEELTNSQNINNVAYVEYINDLYDSVKL